MNLFIWTAQVAFDVAIWIWSILLYLNLRKPPSGDT